MTGRLRDPILPVTEVNPVPRAYARGFGALPLQGVWNIRPRAYARGVLWYGVKMEILSRLQKFFSVPSKGNGNREPTDVVDILIQDYQNLIRLARQIIAHAERAPYPYVAQHLQRIALEKQKSASALKDKILDLGGKPEEADLELHSGKNHWARIVQDLKDQKELENRLLDDASRLALESPEITDLLRQIVSGEVGHRETLQDLIVRADPQANQS